MANAQKNESPFNDLLSDVTKKQRAASAKIIDLATEKDLRVASKGAETHEQFLARKENEKYMTDYNKGDTGIGF
jgi:hypothetical protein